MHLTRVWARSGPNSQFFAVGLSGIDIFDNRMKALQSRLGVQDGAISGIKELPFQLFNIGIIEHQVLRRVVLRTDDMISLAAFTGFLTNNPGLQ